MIMNFKEFKEKLKHFDVYKKKLLISVDFKSYNLFYLIVYDGKVLRFNNTKISWQILQNKFINLQEYKNLSSYVQRELEKKYIEKHLYKKDIQIITYLIPENRRTKNDFNKMSDLVSQFQFNDNSTSVFAKFFQHINQYQIMYIAVYTLFLLLYTVYLQLGLHSLGIPFKFIDSIQNFGIAILFILTVIILIMTLFIPIIVGSLYMIGQLENPMYGYISIIILAMLHLILETKSYTYTRLVHLIKYGLLLLLKLFYQWIPKIVLIIMFFAPFLYTFELMFPDNKKFKAQPTILVNLYQEFYGYPKIIEIKDKKYLLVGKDDTTYQVYDLNKTVNYYHTNQKDSNVMRRLCMNISDKDDDDISLQILMLSPNHQIDNDLEYLKISDTNITKNYSYNAKNIDLNRTILSANCKGIK